MANAETHPLIDELDALMEESKGLKLVSVAKSKPKNDFSDLDELLSESLAIRDEANLNKVLREKLKKGRMSSEEKQETEAKIRKWESRHVWDTVANVAVFEHVSCKCGYYNEVFSHVMHKQVHKHEAKTTRLIVADTIVPDVPKIAARQTSDVDICSECAATEGWDMESTEVIEWRA